MSSACSSDPVGAAAVACPLCEEQGIECVGPKKVPPITVKSLIKPEFQDDVPEGLFYFCPQRDCDAVYFGPGGDPIMKDQLSVGVWQKEEAGDTLICYCFEYSAKDIMEDARRNSPAAIPLIVRDKIKADLCECDVKNPEGTCCLGNIAYWVKQAD